MSIPTNILYAQQLLVVTQSALLVYDVLSGARLEKFELNPTWLQPIGVATGIPLGSVSHSVKVYKGKTFLLVSVLSLLPSAGVTFYWYRVKTNYA
jgi:hypothetical protein